MMCYTMGNLSGVCPIDGKTSSFVGVGEEYCGEYYMSAVGVVNTGARMCVHIYKAVK